MSNVSVVGLTREPELTVVFESSADHEHRHDCVIPRLAGRHLSRLVRAIPGPGGLMHESREVESHCWVHRLKLLVLWYSLKDSVVEELGLNRLQT
jgi:hypothetical protein